jgi:hypothetical protein
MLPSDWLLGRKEYLEEKRKEMMKLNSETYDKIERNILGQTSQCYNSIRREYLVTGKLPSSPHSDCVIYVSGFITKDDFNHLSKKYKGVNFSKNHQCPEEMDELECYTNTNNYSRSLSKKYKGVELQQCYTNTNSDRSDLDYWRRMYIRITIGSEFYGISDKKI